MAVFFRGSNSSLQSKSPPLSFSVSFIPPVSVFSLFYSAFTFSCILFKLSVIICYLSGAFKCMPPALDVPLDAQPRSTATVQLHRRAAVIQSPLPPHLPGPALLSSQQSSYHLVPYHNEEVITLNLLSITSHTHFSNSCACTSSVLT